MQAVRRLGGRRDSRSIEPPPPGDSHTALNGWIPMSKKSRTTILKRQRELRKAEKAAMKREKRGTRGEDAEEGGDGGDSGDQVASRDDLAGYGFPVDAEPDENEKS